MNCPHCDKRVDPNASVCLHCNKDISPAATPTAQLDVKINVSDNNGSVTGVNINEAKGPLSIYLSDPSADRDRDKKEKLRKQVKLEWIEGEGPLKQIENIHATFVRDAGLFKLHKRIQPEAVDYYSRATKKVSHLKLQPNYFPPQKKIGEIFDDMKGALLILGDPGSGKTVTLLELARDLVSRAKKDVNAPIPIVLNLSSWANKSSIFDWIVDELTKQYTFVVEETGRRWVKNHDLVFLLNGLDEVSYQDRKACVAEINNFIRDYGAAGIVVCSRSEEYKQLNTRLKLYGAIVLESLMPVQIEAYFKAAGESLASLHTALQDDPPLRKLAETPLMLHIMSLTYQDVESNDLKIGQFDSVEDRRTHLFDSYIERMLEDEGEGGPFYSKEQAKKWLSLLAENRLPHAQEIFFIEEMQPAEWLTNTPQGTHAVGVRLGGCLTWVLVAIPATGILMGPIFFSGQDPLLQSVRPIFESLNVALSWEQFLVLVLISGGSFVGVILGIVWNVFDWIGVQIGQQMEKLQERHANRRLSDRTWKILSLLAAMVICGLPGGVLGWSVGQGWVLLLSLIGGVSGGFAVMRERRIVVIERFIWSRSKMIGGSLLGLVSGLVLLIVASLILTQDIPVGVVLGIGFGPVLGIIGALMLGLTAREEDREVKGKKRTTPNQGIWQTGRTGLSAGLVTIPSTILLLGFGVGLSLFLYGVTFSNVVETLVSLLTLFAWPAVILGVMVGLSFGGLAFIQHWTLRLILYREELIPRKYVSFLDYAAQRIFLYKVGGGYIFIHRYLLEHFAKMGETEKESS